MAQRKTKQTSEKNSMICGKWKSEEKFFRRSSSSSYAQWQSKDVRSTFDSPFIIARRMVLFPTLHIDSTMKEKLSTKSIQNKYYFSCHLVYLFIVCVRLRRLQKNIR